MKFGKAPSLKNTKTLSFTYLDEILDENEDVKKLYSAQYKPSDDTLNYYKI